MKNVKVSRVFFSILLALSMVFSSLVTSNSIYAEDTIATSQEDSRESRAGSIQINNSSDRNIQVAINFWSSVGANSSFYNVSPGKTDSWGRSDGRGYILLIRQTNYAERSFFVRTSDYVSVTNNAVYINGKPAQHLLRTSSGGDNIVVTNTSGTRVEVSINKYGSLGDTSYTYLPHTSNTNHPNTIYTETWKHRGDAGGFVMAIRKSGVEKLYFVERGDKIDIRDSGNTIYNLTKNKALSPL